MKSRLTFVIFAALTLLISTGADCGGLPGIPRDPWPPVGPESTWTGAPTVFSVVTTISRDAIRYVVDWGDAVDTTNTEYASQETAFVFHVWTTPGTVSIKVQAFNAASPEKKSDWSLAKSVRVIADEPCTRLAPRKAVLTKEALHHMRARLATQVEAGR